MAHIDKSEIVRAAVWIRPTGDALERIEKVARLAHRNGGGGPHVQPHVTLLSGMETTLISAGDCTLRVWDKNGNLIAEDYEPSSLKKDFDWKKVAEQPNEEAMRALRALLGGERDRDGDRRGPPPVRRRD